jgi:integrase/recombinase XerD
MHSYSRKLKLRKDYILQDGTSQLFLSVIVNREKKHFPIGIYLRPEEWDEERQEILPVKKGSRLTKKERDDWQMILNSALGKASDIFMMARANEDPLTIKRFADLYMDQTKRKDFWAFLSKELQIQRQDKTRGTLVNYENTLRKLMRFQKSIQFKDLTWDFLDRFERFLKVQEKQATNSIWRHHRNLRYFINQAIKRGNRIENPYESFKLKQTKSNREYLTRIEVMRLMDLFHDESYHWPKRQVLRYFLFSCFTSLRISDLQRLTMDNLVGDFLVFSPLKTNRTGKMLTIPIPPVARQFIEESIGKVFDMKSDQASNRILKEIAVDAAIDKRLTMHVGRHTFSMMYLESGGRIEELQKILGHSSIATTQIYAHIRNEKIQAGMNDLSDWFEKSAETKQARMERA